MASSSDSALAERLRKAEAEIERVRNLEQRLKEAEAKNKKMEELEERLKQREAESQTVAERLEQAERDAKKARKEAENTRDAVEKSGINVGDQVYAASDAKAGSSKNDLDARIAHLEVNMGHVTEALAVLPQTPPHDSGTRGARERLLFGDAKESERPAPSIQEPDLVANNLYESLVRTLTERLEEYQKRSSLDPQRRASISCIMAIKTGFTRENISGVKRLNEFLGCLCSERHKTQIAHQNSVVKTPALFKSLRKAKSELAGIYDASIEKIFRHLQIPPQTDSERLVAIERFAKQYDEQHINANIGARVDLKA